MEKESKRIYVIKESDDGFESERVFGVFESSGMAVAVLNGLRTYTEYADNGKRYVMETHNIIEDACTLKEPWGKPSFVYFGFTPDCDLWGDYSYMNNNPSLPHKMLVVETHKNYSNDVTLVLRVDVDFNDTPDDVKAKGRKMAKEVFDSLKRPDFDPKVLEHRFPESLEKSGFIRHKDLENGVRQVWVMEVK